MTRKYFGTDGIRGRANTHPMTAEVALKCALAAGHVFKSQNACGNARPKVVLGKDTRLSGYMLEHAMTAGFAAVGMDVVHLGPLPTPAVAMLTRSLRADMGVMISASHNPYQDNGIKLFGSDGFKLSDAVEEKIEHLMDNGLSNHLCPSEEIGKVSHMEDAKGRYVEYVKRVLSGDVTLEGLKIAIDCAHGAAYVIAPMVLRELGAEVIALGCAPNGRNINEGVGATHPKTLCAKVVETGADIGIALDGDADRLIISNEKGEVIDGDQILALIATDWQKSGRLKGDGIAATLMSNMGLEMYLKTLGLKLTRTKVGDRYVMEAMQEHALNIGGEQSGHMILSDYATTGDGLLAALEVLSVLKTSGKKASEVLSVFKPLPQLLENVRFKAGNPVDDPSVKTIISAWEKTLSGQGRLVIRKSGTEPVVRVMGEAENEEMLKTAVTEISAAIKKVAG